MCVCERQTDRQIDRGRQIDRQTDRQREREITVEHALCDPMLLDLRPEVNTVCVVKDRQNRQEEERERVLPVIPASCDLIY